MNAVMEVMDKLKPMEPTFTWDIDAWTVDVLGDDCIFYSETNKSLAMAICFVALKMKGIEI